MAILFLTLFLDLVGFSIIFPLFPAMLDYYLPNGAGDSTWLGQVMETLVTWSKQSGANNPNFMATVLFGGLLGSLYSILQFIFAPIWGAYSDRYGRRPILLLTIFGLVFSYGLWIFASSFYLLVLARVIGGIMGGNLSVATAAIADISSKDKRSASLAIVGICLWFGLHHRTSHWRFEYSNKPNRDRTIARKIWDKSLLICCRNQFHLYAY